MSGLPPAPPGRPEPGEGAGHDPARRACRHAGAVALVTGGADPPGPCPPTRQTYKVWCHTWRLPWYVQRAVRWRASRRTWRAPRRRGRATTHGATATPSRTVSGPLVAWAGGRRQANDGARRGRVVLRRPAHADFLNQKPWHPMNFKNQASRTRSLCSSGAQRALLLCGAARARALTKSASRPLLARTHRRSASTRRSSAWRPSKRPRSKRRCGTARGAPWPACGEGGGGLALLAVLTPTLHGCRCRPLQAEFEAEQERIRAMSYLSEKEQQRLSMAWMYTKPPGARRGPETGRPLCRAPAHPPTSSQPWSAATLRAACVRAGLEAALAKEEAKAKQV